MKMDERKAKAPRAATLRAAVKQIGDCLDIINDWDREGSIDHSLAYDLHRRLNKAFEMLTTDNT